MLVCFYKSQYFHTRVCVGSACKCIYKYTVFISFYACMCFILEGAPSQDMFLLFIVVEKHEMIFAVLVVVNKHESGSQPGLQAATAAACHNASSVVLAGATRGGARCSSVFGLVAAGSCSIFPPKPSLVCRWLSVSRLPTSGVTGEA